MTMNKKRLLWQLPLLTLLIVGTILIIRQQRSLPYQHDTGFIFGTVYNITYQSSDNLKTEIETALKEVDNALSMFNEQSILSRINHNEPIVTNTQHLTPITHFNYVVTLAQKISDETNGAFDITVAPLVNLWGFGFKHGTTPDKHVIDSIRQFVGYQKITLDTRQPTVSKADPRIMLDCSAIAKGYGCDVVANLLRQHNIRNFMVEIGGEVVTSGISEKRVPWRIGVTKPIDDSLNTHQELQTVLNVTDKAMATSGNYRNFYYKDGKKYAHTIDPNTGYPVQHSLLSATVLAKDCATADAYATSFMVLGVDGTKRILEHHPELMAYLIYSDEKGALAVWYSPTLKDKIN